MTNADDSAVNDEEERIRFPQRRRLAIQASSARPFSIQACIKLWHLAELSKSMPTSN
jgi:hypothetical protein